MEAPEQDHASLDRVPSDMSSLSGGTFSLSEPSSSTESIEHMMDEILSNKTMNRFSKNNELEAIPSAATFLPDEQVRTVFRLFLGKFFI